jgi:hypothetical protein
LIKSSTMAAAFAASLWHDNMGGVHIHDRGAYYRSPYLRNGGMCVTTAPGAP